MLSLSGMKRLLFLLLAACGPISIHLDGRNPPSSSGHACLDGTDGQSDRACFAWRSGPDLSTPIADGAEADVEVAADVSVSLSSSDPSVLSVDSDGHVRALRPGTADVIAYDSRGVEEDRATATVVPTVALDTDAYASRLAVLEGATGYFHVSTVGPGGVRTVGSGAVAFDASGTARASTNFLFRTGDVAEVSGSAGHGTVLASADGALEALDLDFLDDVSAITLRVDSIDRHFDGTATANIVAVAGSPFGPVWGAPCAWTTSPAARVSQSVNGFDSPAGAWSALDLDLRGTTYVATCAIGSQRATIRIIY